MNVPPRAPRTSGRPAVRSGSATRHSVPTGSDGAARSDLGHSDLGAFGGEIRTPNLDALAWDGRLLTDHHTAPTCCPTRAMFYSGTDHHLVGLGTMAERIAPEQEGEPGYEGNGVETTVPEDFFSTEFYTDKLIDYLEQSRGDAKPFLAIATYTAPHWPLQVPDSYLDRYKGKYDEGYDAIRERRIARQKALGIIPRSFVPHEPFPSTTQNPRWEDLTPEQRRFEARRMEIYAAMVEHLDFHIGRLISYLKRTGQYEDTFIFFQSDNGAEGGSGFASIETNDNSYDNLGRRYSNVAYGLRWGEVSAAPFNPWKGHASEGGVLVPAIARLPKQRLARLPFAGFTHVTDLAPTFLELARARDPGSRYKGRDVYPITGKSILPRLERRAFRVHGPEEVFVDELFGRRYVRRDDWKLVYNELPYGTGGWALYDLARDPAESRDLTRQHPQIVAELRAAWDAYATRVGVVLPGYNLGP